MCVGGRDGFSLRATHGNRQANLRHNRSLRQELLCGLHALDLFQHLDSNLLTLKLPLPNLCQKQFDVSVITCSVLVKVSPEGLL